MSKCLVTGGSGFIGSHIVEFLLDKGHDVTVVDNQSANNDKFYWRSETNNVKSDICDFGKLVDAMEGVEYVFHLAAESRLQPAIENPIQAVYRNCVGTTTVLQA